MTAWIPLLMQGTITTCIVWAAASCISLTLGVIIGTLRSTFVHGTFTRNGQARNNSIQKQGFELALGVLGLISLVLRGIPLYAQLMIVYFVLPQVIHVNLAPLSTGIITLGICSAAHVSEIIRGALNSIAPGQWQAGKMLGYTMAQQLRFIILPQMVRNALPGLTNEYVMVMKSTSILASIGTLELTKISMNIMYRSFNPLGVSLSIACIYLVLTALVAGIGQLLERKYNVNRPKSFL